MAASATDLETGRLFAEKSASLITAASPAMLEVGCGHGVAAGYMRSLARRLTLIDVDKTAIATLDGRWPGDKNVAIKQCDILAVQGSFDVIYYFLSLHHITNTVAELSAARRLLLRPSGQLLICEYEPVPGKPFHKNDYSPHDGFSHEELIIAASQSGISVSGIYDIATLPHYGTAYNVYVADCRLRR